MIIGAIFLAIGSFHSIIIINQNRNAHSARNEPKILLTQGYYAKARHSMYSMFFIIFSGLAFALSSSLGIAVGGFTIFVLVILIYAEERQILLPIFGEEYKIYKQQVPRFFLQNWQWVLLIFYLSFNVIGIFF